MSNKAVVEQTKAWLKDIIIGLNFCPFAKKEFVNNTIEYQTSSCGQVKVALQELIAQCQYLVENPKAETTLLIFERGFKQFDSYLQLLDYASQLIDDSGYEGVFQLASFHPYYCFEGEAYDDAANFTNRSPFPMIHIIREKSMEKVLRLYKNPENIPINNVNLARSKGVSYFENSLAKIKLDYE